ncbi:MAG: hypothetical protein RJB34_773 [Pseudomonadota bacterium]|jgi:NADH dehydrogenase FAD-containing subunit
MNEAPKHLLLIGAGHAHVHFLRRWAAKPCPGWRVTLLCTKTRHTHSAMLAGYLTGRYTAQDCQIDLPPLMEQAGVTWIQGQCVGIKTHAHPDPHQVTYTPLDGTDGIQHTLACDLLSIEEASSPDGDALEKAMPGASEHALSLHPVEALVAVFWPKVIEAARQHAPSVVVIGAGTEAVELVFAAEQSLRLNGVSGARFGLVTGSGPWLHDVPEAIRQGVVAQLRQRQISLIHATCTAIGGNTLELDSQTQLTCDVPILAMDSPAPVWTNGCGLALLPSGHVLTTPHLRSTNNERVFVVGEASACQDQPNNREAANSLAARDTLAYNLWATVAGKWLKKYHPSTRGLRVVSFGAGQAIAQWRRWTVEGALAWWWKSRQDRAVVRAYQKAIRLPKTTSAESSSRLAD